MPEKVPHFDFFMDEHFGLGVRWRRSSFFTGWDVSLAFPFCCLIVSTGRRRERQ